MTGVPVLLVTGFLGAGKTTLVNALLAQADGRRIAAVVNDFGAVNIDAELLAGAADGVVSLAGGCLCCALEGDLLRTLSRLLRHEPRPEAIVIECSGAAEPAAVVRTLMDPMVWREAPLETVLCVLDAAAPPADPLADSQLRAADLVALTRTDLADPAAARAHAARVNPRAPVLNAPHGRVPLALLLPELPGGAPRAVPRAAPHADRFESLSWTHPGPLSLPRLQAAVARLAPRLVRAKGVFEADGRSLLLQLAGGRATLAPAPTGIAPGARLVFIAELGTLPEAELRAALEGCREEGGDAS